MWEERFHLLLEKFLERDPQENVLTLELFVGLMVFGILIESYYRIRDRMARRKEVRWRGLSPPSDLKGENR